ncbi:WGR domain-containing protein [Jhaorihella thermophila]
MRSKSPATCSAHGCWCAAGGRIGRGGGQSLVESYPDRAQAEQARRKLAATKLRRGYA